jgi:hypothetical protein
MAHIPPQPVDLPAQPRDPRVPLPFQPQYPPTVAEVCKAVQYRQHVESSMRKQFPSHITFALPLLPLLR